MRLPKLDTSLVVLAAAVAAAAACSRAPEPKRPAGDSAASATAAAAAAPQGALTDAARASLDSGNTAYRAGRYDAALAHYRGAARAWTG